MRIISTRTTCAFAVVGVWIHVCILWSLAGLVSCALPQDFAGSLPRPVQIMLDLAHPTHNFLTPAIAMTIALMIFETRSKNTELKYWIHCLVLVVLAAFTLIVALALALSLEGFR